MDLDDDDMPLASIKKPKSKPKKIKADPAPSNGNAAVKKRKREATSPPPTSNKKKKGALKELDKAERLQYAMQAFLWWNAKEPPEGCQWDTMEHAGVSFPEPYEPHGVKMLYDGEPVTLTPLEEEA